MATFEKSSAWADTADVCVRTAMFSKLNTHENAEQDVKTAPPPCRVRITCALACSEGVSGLGFQVRSKHDTKHDESEKYIH